MRTILAGALLVLAFALAPASTAAGVKFGAELGMDVAPPPPPALPPPPDVDVEPPALPEAEALPAPAELEVVAESTTGVDVQAPLSLEPSGQAPPAEPPLDVWRQALPGDGQVPVPEVPAAAPAAVATVGLLAVLQSLGVFRWMGVAGVALYSRLARSELLDNGHRDRVYKLVQEHPGLGLSEIMERCGLGWGTTVYHLDRLERAGFVASERAGLHRCYFPVGTVPKESRKGMGALKADTTRSIAEFLVARPGATQTELCAALGMSASAASKQITKLESAGLVRRERDWKTVHLYPEGPLPALLAGEPAPAAPAPVAAVPA